MTERQTDNPSVPFPRLPMLKALPQRKNDRASLCTWRLGLHACGATFYFSLLLSQENVRLLFLAYALQRLYCSSSSAALGKPPDEDKKRKLPSPVYAYGCGGASKQREEMEEEGAGRGAYGGGRLFFRTEHQGKG